MRTNTRRANGWRRNQAIKRVRAAYDTCHLCGRPIDKTLPAGDPWSLEVDEIIPVSQGGSPTDFGNLAAAHRICNEYRGNHSVQWAQARLAGHQPEPKATRLPLKADDI